MSIDIRIPGLEIRRGLTTGGNILHDDKLWPAELECTYFTPRDSDA